MALIAAAPLPDGRVQVFVIDPNDQGNIYTTWKATSDSNAAWTHWVPLFSAGAGFPPGARDIAIAMLSDARLQLLVCFETGLWTTWKATTDPNAAWVNPLPFSPMPPAIPLQTAAAPLSDRRPQLWAVTNSGVISTWKVSTASASGWVNWSPFNPS